MVLPFAQSNEYGGYYVTTTQFTNKRVVQWLESHRISHSVIESNIAKDVIHELSVDQMAAFVVWFSIFTKGAK